MAPLVYPAVTGQPAVGLLATRRQFGKLLSDVGGIHPPTSGIRRDPVSGKRESPVGARARRHARTGRWSSVSS